jgi:hypothetical protein
MKKLFEQIDWNAVSNSEDPLDATKTSSTVVKPKDDTRKDDTRRDDTRNDDTKPEDKNKDKNKVKKSAELIALERSLSNPTQAMHVNKLLVNAIQYIKYLPGYMDHTDIDEYAVMDFMLKHLRTSNGLYGEERVRYCDLIYRFANSTRYATLHKLIKKFPIEYKYFLSRNGHGLTFERIATNLTFFTPFQNDSNDWAEYLDWEDKGSDPEIGKRFSKLSHSFKYFNPPVSIKIMNRFSDLDIHNLVIACYNVNAFGKPVDWLRKKK